MFQIVKERTFIREVKVNTPGRDEAKEESLIAVFKFLDSEDARKHDLTTAIGTDAFLKEVVIELRDLTDENGQPLTPSAELTASVLKLQFVRNALVSAYFEVVTGAKSGN